MQFDDILVHLGEFGRHQRFQYFLVCLISLTNSLQAIVNVYVMATPKHRCRLPDWSNDTFDIQSTEHRKEIERWIPPGDSCYRLANSMNTSKVYCGDADGWVFDHAEFTNSFVSEFQLVCDLKFWSAIVSMCFLAGVLVGSIFFGWASDRFGRKPTLVVANFLMFSLGSLAAAVSNPYAIGAFKFLIGWTCAGAFPIAFVLGMEMVGPSMRFHAGMIIEYAFAIGLILLAGVAYLLRYWRWLQLAISVPVLLYLSYWWLIPESPRWLLANNRAAEAKLILMKIAKTNGVVLPEELLNENNVMFKEKNNYSSKNENFRKLIKSKILLLRSLNICFQWFVIAMVYYGLSLNTGSLPGNIYANSLMSAAVEIPGYAIAHITINRFGRRWPHSLSMIIGGVACSSTLFLVIFVKPDSANWAFILLTMLGKLFITTAFAIIYLWSAEMLPTPVRNVGIGTASMFGRVGSILAPTIGRLQEYITSKFGAALPLLIFGAASVAAGVCALFLPESLGEPLPETIEEGELFGKKKSKLLINETESLYLKES